jgi:hypothetical protein
VCTSPEHRYIWWSAVAGPLISADRPFRLPFALFVAGVLPESTAKKLLKRASFIAADITR